MYEQVFPSIAQNAYATFAEYDSARSLPSKNGELLANVKGHITLHPIQFLRDENSKMWKEVLNEELFM